MKQCIDINPQFKKALDLLENTDKHLFITGKAGTGKSTLLKYFQQQTSKKTVVLAPTGVAAVNIAGETIHSFFKFKPDITIDKIKKIKGKSGQIYKQLDTIIIDEISMVRADLLDCVDKFLRVNGKHKNLLFGGTQMIFIGDLYQLPPVVNFKEKHIFSEFYPSPYFFSSRALQGIDLEFIELEKIYRQKDREFIDLLNVIRNNTISWDDLDKLNQRVGHVFAADKKALTIHLTTTNQAADQINRQHLAKLGNSIYAWDAEIYGDFGQNSFPSDQYLQLAIGSQVMMVNNDSQGRWVNGTLGVVSGIHKGGISKDRIFVTINEQEHEISLIEWELFHFTWDKTRGTLDSEVVGSFIQYPLRLAWAVTIHKAQGKTFDRVIIDMGAYSFAHGQAYVALSRCTSFEGISLKQPLRKHHISSDQRIIEFMRDLNKRG